MQERVVIGIFEGKGTAEDAVHRLVFEGADQADVSLRVLREIGPVSPEEIEGLTLDPFEAPNFLAGRYAPYIRNGETAVLVRVRSDAEEERGVNTLRAYSPVLVETVSRGEENAALAEQTRSAPQR